LQAIRWCYKQLLSKATPYTGGTNSCFISQLPTLGIHPHAGGTDTADQSSKIGQVKQHI